MKSLVEQKRLGWVHFARRFQPFRWVHFARRLPLAWEEDGWCLWYKRLEEGIFRFPISSSDGPPRVEIRAAELAMLLDGVVLEKVQRRKRYHRPATAK